MTPVYKIDVNIPPEKMLQLYGGSITNGVWTPQIPKDPEPFEYYYKRGHRHYFCTASGVKLSVELPAVPDFLKRGGKYNLHIKSDFAKAKNLPFHSIKLSSN